MKVEGMLLKAGPQFNLRNHLENLEVEAPRCVPTNEIYSRLLAVYIYEKDLCNAKFLWKRIPDSAKTSEELKKIWDVGRSLWQRDNQSVFAIIELTKWSDQVAEIMMAIRDRVRSDNVMMVGQSYTSISLSNFSTYVGLPNGDALKLASQQPGWEYDEISTMILPKRPIKADETAMTTDLQLSTLTDFVAFLER